MRVMTLEPTTYSCPEHKADLTVQVQEALEDRGPVAYQGIPLLGKAAARARPFEVTVTCPGTADSGPHDLICSGIRTQ